MSDRNAPGNEYPYPEPLPAGVCRECGGKGWVEGERLGGQFEQLTCTECDGSDEPGEVQS